MGHLASSCSQNAHGIYVNGGCCRNCGSQSHLATACPEKKKNKREKDHDKIKGLEETAVEDLLETVPQSKTTRNSGQQSKSSLSKKEEGSVKKKKRVVKF
jgi:hypothetical protein